MSRAAQTITPGFGTTEPRMPDRKEDIMTRILSLAAAALMLTAIAAPSAEARRHHTMHHRMMHRHAMHAMHHGRGHHTMMSRSAAPSGDASTDQLNQQSLNTARGQ